MVQRSQDQRGKSTQMRSHIENTINGVSSQIWDAWSKTNNALARRAAEVLEAKSKLQMHLQKVDVYLDFMILLWCIMYFHFKVQQEIFDIEKNIELIRKAITDKSNPMKVAHTRLEARTHRKGIELCRDMAQDKYDRNKAFRFVIFKFVCFRLVQEVKDLQDSIEYLHRKLQEAEAQHQQLLKTRSNLESDLHNKVNSLFIDREKCMGMRRSFPITATIKY